MYASGRYRDISVSGETSANGLTLIYAGVPRYYVGRVEVEWRACRKGSHRCWSLRPSSILERRFVSRRFRPRSPVCGSRSNRMDTFEANVQVATTRDDVNNQVNVTFTIKQGPQARVGNVGLQGKDPGIYRSGFSQEGQARLRMVLNAREQVHLARLQGEGHARYDQHGAQWESASITRRTTGSKARSVSRAIPTRLRANNSTISFWRTRVLSCTSRLRAQRSRTLARSCWSQSTKSRHVDRDLVNEGAFNIRDYHAAQGLLRRRGFCEAAGPRNEQRDRAVHGESRQAAHGPIGQALRATSTSATHLSNSNCA